MSTWDVGLFSCFSEPKICLVTWCCAPCQLAHQKAVVEGKECSVVDAILADCFFICFATMIRGKVREKYGIPGGCCGDCCTIYFCALCALVQQHNQLIAKGDKPAGCFMD
eukprot:NODE_2011_length_672_cov_185.988991_g1961_i0.p1 GENE.NODE_2011_length_672_cov_185.988991_g1961_i0~~NODE_2011_length_672_cov_185.988991_g1961_i0.p1  ORF type:complete len:110 (+),score=22.41 NODE_2011_length_672_cov_185.988991_g1961_i0:80-409(+)